MYKKKHQIKKTMILESLIEDKLEHIVESAGGLCMKLTPRAMVGIPDRLVILPDGRIIFVELKRLDGFLSVRQKHCHQLLKSLGCEVKVLYGEDDVTNLWKKRLLEQIRLIGLGEGEST